MSRPKLFRIAIARNSFATDSGTALSPDAYRSDWRIETPITGAAA